MRSNHVHTLASTGSLKPERALNALKANATRLLRQAGYWERPHTPWADGGSRRYLWTELGIERAMDYVINGQGGEIPDFEERRPGQHSPIRYRERY